MITSPQQLFTPPDKFGFTIYTKSKCSFCDKIKELFETITTDDDYFFISKSVTFVQSDDYLESHHSKFLEFIDSFSEGRTHRTFPMVFYCEKLIGGFTDMEEWLLNECVFNTWLKK
jgi:glutaredoxin